LVTDARRTSQLELIKQFEQMHGNRYDYTKVEYINNSLNVEIICEKHGSFFQNPYAHKIGTNCPQCAFAEKSRGAYYTQERLIEQFKQAHGDKYNYNKVNFKTVSDKVLIICPEHGEFKQEAYSHLRGCGCPTCVGQDLDTGKVITQFKKAHGDKYNYSKVDYKGVQEKVTIICPEHGEFDQLPTSHKSGNGCPACGNYGFDGTLPAILYYLRIDNGKAYKIGVTNYSVEERFKKYELNIIDIIRVWSFDIGFDARNIEQEILGEYQEFKYHGDPLLINGNTELFKQDVLNLDYLLI